MLRGIGVSSVSEEMLRSESATFSVGTSSELSRFGEGRHRLDTSTYLAATSPDLLLFDRAPLSRAPGLAAKMMLAVPRFFAAAEAGAADVPGVWAADAKRAEAATLVVGRHGYPSGIGWHFHKDNWLELVHGTKRWYLYPPGTACRFSRVLYVYATLSGLPPQARRPQAASGWRSRSSSGCAARCPACRPCSGRSSVSSARAT